MDKPSMSEEWGNETPPIFFIDKIAVDNDRELSGYFVPPDEYFPALKVVTCTVTLRTNHRSCCEPDNKCSDEVENLIKFLEKARGHQLSLRLEPEVD